MPSRPLPQSAQMISSEQGLGLGAFRRSQIAAVAVPQPLAVLDARGGFQSSD